MINIIDTTSTLYHTTSIKDIISSHNKLLYVGKDKPEGFTSINTIKKVVCDYYGINKNQLNSKIRTKNIAIPRQIAMYLVRKFLDMPYKDIGNSFGKRDHSTVINACERVEENIKKDPAYAMAINALEEMIKK